MTTMKAFLDNSINKGQRRLAQAMQLNPDAKVSQDSQTSVKFIVAVAEQHFNNAAEASKSISGLKGTRLLFIFATFVSGLCCLFVIACVQVPAMLGSEVEISRAWFVAGINVGLALLMIWESAGIINIEYVIEHFSQDIDIHLMEASQKTEGDYTSSIRE